MSQDPSPEHEITAGPVRAVVRATGAALRLLEVDGLPLTESYPPDTKPPMACGVGLVPWPNRTGDGRFDFGGATHQLELTEPSKHNASHGLLRHVEYALVSHTGSAVEQAAHITGDDPGWPWPLHVLVRHEVVPGGIDVTTTVTNTGTEPAPLGVGFHPYLRVGDLTVDDVSLETTATHQLPLDPERSLPSGPVRPVAGTALDFSGGRSLAGAELDDALTGLTPDPDGLVRHRVRGPDGSGVCLWADPAFGWVQVFITDVDGEKSFPGRGRALAVEPMTCPPDALRSGTDVITVAPGETWSAGWGIAAL
ncbi:aldose 1-epimerase family protein [Rhodococcus aerolatus]